MLRSLLEHVGTALSKQGDSTVDWLILGLGNPGPKYARTRHNVGRDAVALLAERTGIGLSRIKHAARFGTGRIGDQRVCLAVTTVYMNESGRPAGALARFYDIPPQRLLPAYDDMDLPLGQLRLRQRGGHGGHNGMRSVLDHLATSDVPRLRMGIGRPPEGWEPKAYVLGRFSDDRAQEAAQLIEDAADALEEAVRHGIEHAMNHYNG